MQNSKIQATDKAFLRNLTKSDYEMSNIVDYFALARALLINFASPDPELRDELSYMILASGIINKNRLTPEETEELLFTSLDKDHLFYKIGEINSDSVFMRSFSNLCIAAILYADNQDPQLSMHAIRQVKNALVKYARAEKDWRGYIEGKGWAHAMAHLADALDECIQSPHTTTEEREELLALIGELARIPEPLYHEEDMRLAAAVHHIIGCKQVNDDALYAWLQSCTVERGSDVTSWISVTNTKNFLRSLYFLLLWDNMAIHILDIISDVLRQQDEVYVETVEQD